MAKDDKNNGLGRVDPLSAFIYLMTLGYAGKAPVFGGPNITELPPQEFRPEEHYTKSLAPVDAVNPKARGTLQMQKGRDYRG